MLEEVFPDLTEARWKDIAEGFYKRWQFPNCIGAIDGKHVRLRKPALSGSLFYNYKNFFSVVLLAIVDADYNFIFIDVGSYGKESDSSIFRRTMLHDKLENNQLNILQGAPLPGTEEPNLNYTFIGDEAFSLSPYMMRPYSGKSLSYTKRIFNYRLSRARRTVESAFGILSNKWQLFHRPINLNLDCAVLIIKTCCALHNYVRSRDGFRLEDSLSIVELSDVQHINIFGEPSRAPNQVL